MATKVETTITITHLAHSQRIVVKSPTGRQLLLVEAPPKVALRAASDYLRTWANRGEGRVRE
jgi:hypothetical protein